MADLTGGRGNWVVALRPTGLMAGWLELHDLANPHDSVPEAADLKPQLTDLSKRAGTECSATLSAERLAEIVKRLVLGVAAAAHAIYPDLKKKVGAYFCIQLDEIMWDAIAARLTPAPAGGMIHTGIG